jgi:hypothetical protein
MLFGRLLLENGIISNFVDASESGLRKYELMDACGLLIFIRFDICQVDIYQQTLSRNL